MQNQREYGLCQSNGTDTMAESTPEGKKKISNLVLVLAKSETDKLLPGWRPRIIRELTLPLPGKQGAIQCRKALGKSESFQVKPGDTSGREVDFIVKGNIFTGVGEKMLQEKVA